MPTTYPFDPSGSAATNLITNEQQTLTPTLNTYNVLVPKAAPYYGNSLQLTHTDLNSVTRTLVEGVDYYKSHNFIGASRAIGQPVYGSICLLNLSLSGLVSLHYQTIGDTWVVDAAGINTILSDLLRNPRTTTWEQVTDLPTVFPPTPHQWNLTDMVGMSELTSGITAVANNIAQQALATPTINLPVLVQSKQVTGLGNVDNFRTATDTEAVAGASNARFMTPRTTRLAIAAQIDAYEQSRSLVYKSDTVPTTGFFNKTDYVQCTNQVVRQWHSIPQTAIEGISYVLVGWIRMTTGSLHVLGTDWVEDRRIIG